MDRKNVPPAERLFIGCFSTGIFYADKLVEVEGDYKRLGFLPFDTLVLDVEKSCPPALRAEIISHAKTVQDQAGGDYTVSTCGQTVLLGGRQPPPLRLPFDPALSLNLNIERAGFVRDEGPAGFGHRYLRDIKTGRRYGPFDYEEAVAWLKSAKA